MPANLKLQNAFSVIRKAIVATVATVALTWLHKLGVEIPIDALSVALDAAIVGGVTYAVPNAKPYFKIENGDDNES